MFKGSMKNDLGLVQEALAAGAEPGKPNPLGLTPIEAAVHHGNVEMARALLEAGCGMPATSHGGRTLMVKAHAERNGELKALLVGHGARLALLDRVTAFVLRRKG